MLGAIHRVFEDFQMPGVAMPNFLRRSVEAAKAGVYNLRIHHDRVVQPLIRDWNIGDLTGLAPVAAELQSKIMELPARILRKAEAFERRARIRYV